MIKISKNNSIAIIALIFSLGGLGLGAYQYFFPASTTQESGVRIYNSEGGTLNVLEGTVTEIPELILDFTVGAGEDAFFLFTGTAYLNSSSGAGGVASFLQFVFRLDGETAGFTNFEIPEVNAENFSIPITFFSSIYDFTAGTHNLTVTVYSSTGLATVYFNRLYVQTFYG